MTLADRLYAARTTKPCEYCRYGITLAPCGVCAGTGRVSLDAPDSEDAYAHYCPTCGYLLMMRDGARGEGSFHICNGERRLAVMYGFGHAIEKGLRAIAGWTGPPEKALKPDDYIFREGCFTDHIEEVRGWRKWRGENWLVRDHMLDLLDYRVTKGDGIKAVVARHVESGKTFFARDRLLTLREVVDIIDPAAKPPSDPAVGDVLDDSAEAPEPLTCDDCGVDLISDSWPRHPSEPGNVATVHPDGTMRCVYCERRSGERRENGPGITAAPTAVIGEDGDCFERPGFDWP